MISSQTLLFHKVMKWYFHFQGVTEVAHDHKKIGVGQVTGISSLIDCPGGTRKFWKQNWKLLCKCLHYSEKSRLVSDFRNPLTVQNVF